MTESLYDALEICLQALEQGMDLEACLVRFPTLADELRPILQVAVQARAQAVQDVPADAMRRGRARVLQHAAELRERGHVATVPLWRRPGRAGRAFRAVATLIMMVVFMLSGGTGLVFASSGSLPGDRLYTVKRSWEDVQLAFAVDPQVKLERETEFEQERIHEIKALFSENRKTQVNFQGMVETQQKNVWRIAGLQIEIDPEMAVNAQIVPGSLVQVIGETENGIIKAEQIELIRAPAVTPTTTPTLRPLPTWTPEQKRTHEPTEKVDEQLNTSETPEAPEIHDTQEPGKTETTGGREPSETPGSGDHGGGGDNGGGDGGGGSGSSSSGGG